jgi:hypothetical protein
VSSRLVVHRARRMRFAQVQEDMLTLYSCSQQAIDGLQGWADECGIVFLVYLFHGHATSRASTLIFSLLGAHPSELFEGSLQASRYVGRKHLARPGPDDLGGVNRPRAG